MSSFLDLSGVSLKNWKIMKKFEYTLEYNTEGAITNGQSRETGNIGRR
jgi:hypothetical protein